MKIAIVLVLAVMMLLLVRKNLLQVDITFPLFVGLVVLGFASMSDSFIHWSAAKLGIIHPPIAVILMAIAILLAIITSLAIAYSRLCIRQHMLVRYLAQHELDRQEIEWGESNGN